MQRVCLGEAPLLKKQERKFYKVSLRGASISFCGQSYDSSSIFPGFYLKRGENNSGYFKLLVPQWLPNKKSVHKEKPSSKRYLCIVFGRQLRDSI